MSRIHELLREYGNLSPEPGRTRLGYSEEDCLALLSAVAKEDDKKKGQSWKWLSDVSGIPVSTLRRILEDHVANREHSVLARVAEQYHFLVKTQARIVILESGHIGYG
jgi:hypothetical protein